MITDFRIPEIEELSAKIDRLEKLITINLLTGKNTVCVADIARYEGVSKSFLYNGAAAYLLPRFGESGFPEGQRRWEVSEYLEWRAIDPFERRKAYEKYLRGELKKDQLMAMKKRALAQAKAQEKMR